MSVLIQNFMTIYKKSCLSRVIPASPIFKYDIDITTFYTYNVISHHELLWPVYEPIYNSINSYVLCDWISFIWNIFQFESNISGMHDIFLKSR